MFSSSFLQPDFLDWLVSGRQVAPSYRRPHCKTYWKRRSHCTERRIATWILWGPAKTELYCNDHVAIVLDLAMGQEIALILPPVDLKHQHKPRVFMQPSFWLFDNWTEILPFRIYQLLLFVCMIVGSIQKLFSTFKLESAFCKLICNSAILHPRFAELTICCWRYWQILQCLAMCHTSYLFVIF